jgi:hypothetical protein
MHWLFLETARAYAPSQDCLFPDSPSVAEMNFFQNRTCKASTKRPSTARGIAENRPALAINPGTFCSPSITIFHHPRRSADQP